MTDPHNAATTRDDHDDEAAFTIRVQPTHQMMLYLAAMPLNPQQPPITIRMTERQYRQMPGHGESILEHLVVEHQHSEHSVQTYEAAQLNYYLASLRQAYNAENPQPPVRHQPEPCRHAGRTDRKGTKRARQMLRPGHANQAKCHFPLRCSEAACNHLRKYDEEITAERMRSLEEQTKFMLSMAALPQCSKCNVGDFATLTVTGRFRRSSDKSTIFVVGTVKRRRTQNDEDRPLDNSGAKATNVAQDTTRALSIGV